MFEEMLKEFMGGAENTVKPGNNGILVNNGPFGGGYVGFWKNSPAFSHNK